MEKYAHILQPLRIGNTVFRNRLFSAPTGLYDLTPDRAPTDDYIAYYERKAKGGCASINIGECNIDNEGVGSPNSYEIPNLSEHKLNKEALGKLANAISRNGAVATIELQKTGRIKSDTPGQMQLLSPSDGFHPYDGRVKCRAMTEEEIRATIDAYASAAEYAKGRGFGMVMVHAGHGWLLHQFHCPKSNRRTDQWGGNPENRWPSRGATASRRAWRLRSSWTATRTSSTSPAATSSPPARTSTPIPASSRRRG